jgi:hypothetical protein
MSGYWYIGGADGRRYCFAKEPTFVCPMSEPVVFDRPEDGADREPVPRLTVPAITPAAEQLAMSPLLLANLIRSAHNRPGAGRARVDGRLTETCAACGHKLIRKGFRYWIEAKPAAASSRTRIARRLGFSEYEQVEGSWYAKTKRDARTWARGRADAA